MHITVRAASRTLVVVTVLAMAVMVWGTVHTYRHAPPVPDRVVTAEGTALFTAADVVAGKEVFQRRNLMNFGTILGNGGYFGPDFTAEYLDRLAALLGEAYAQERFGRALDALAPDDRASIANRVQGELKRNTLDAGTLTVSAAHAAAHGRIRAWYADRFVGGEPAEGIAPGALRTRDDAHRFADFVAWTAWFAAARRPGRAESYTSNWPYEPALGNVPTPLNFFWTVATIGIVFLMIGVLLLAYRSVALDPVDIVPMPRLEGFVPGPLQRAVVPLFAVAAGLFLVQTVAGGYLANAFASREDFYGIFGALGLQRMGVFPFHAIRAVHVELAVFWVLGMWMASAAYFAPFLGGRDSKGLGAGGRLLVGILVASVVGSLGGVYLGTKGLLDGAWYWLGSEGLEYVEMGRVWKLGIIAAFAVWLALMGRSLGARLRGPLGGLPRLVLAAGAAIAAAFLASLAYRPETNFVITDFWRWWTVHLWVEGIFAFFQLLVTALLLGGMGLITGELAAKSIYFEAVLVLLAGILSIGHHYWWVGQPTFWLGIGSVFSTLEIIPLVLLLFHAAEQYRWMRSERTVSPHRLVLWFLIASGVWQFIGSGVLGLLINFPLVNYYEHGTYLTVAHSHGSFLGGFGFLAIGLALFCLQYATGPIPWREGRLRFAFWTLNLGLALMLVVSVVPVGFLQLQEVYRHGVTAGRSLAFYNQPVIQQLMKWRMPGDSAIILGALVLFMEMARLAWVAHRRRPH